MLPPITGAYVPLTTQGNLVADRVLASCYPSVRHELSHIGMTPMRWFPKLIEWTFGDEGALSGYVILSDKLGEWILPNGQLFKY